MLKQFFNEVTILSRIHHQNLVSLHGCTYPHSQQLLLVYEFVPNGTVEDHLHGPRPSLPWRVRILIAIETAEALVYLHSLKPAVIHRDIKTSNILLDSAFHVKVADLGMCRLLPRNTTSVSTAPQGTVGYRDPEYELYYNLTDKSDVYSFGVVLLELVSGKKVVDINRHLDEIFLVRMALDKIINKELDQLVDQELEYHSDCEVSIMIKAVVELACKCLRTKGDMRPSMAQVLKLLKEIKDGKQHIDGSHSTQACVFSYEELHEATNSLDPLRELGNDKLNKLYLGKLRDGQMVAVKVLKDCNSEQLEQMFKDVTVVSRLHHKNLVTLYGCTNPRRQGMLLVYEHVPSGSVADQLHVQQPALTWTVRIQIAIETAEALAYLHSLEMPIVHRHVKTSNILLDSSFHVKVANLGMFHKPTMPQSTLGYQDPEFSDYNLGCKFTGKSDVYSFGVVLVELISGKQVGDVNPDSGECYLVSMALDMIINKKLDKLADPELEYHSVFEVRRTINLVAKLAFSCLQLKGSMRPPMVEVLEVLKGIQEGKHIHDKDLELEEVNGVGRVFSHEEIRLATDSFKHPLDLEGNRGKVFLGKLPHGQMVAVKVLKDCNSEQLEQMFHEATIISRLHHENLFTLYGCTNPGNQEMLLVYEYVPTVTVADHLHIQRLALPWSVRIQIAIETSNVLAYLHSLEMPIIHRYVNISNILLDNAFHVKVADLGMFHETVPQGNLGYRDPQFSACHPLDLTEKIDVYSMGVMLVELISGQPVGDVNDKSRECYLVNVALNMIINKKLEKLVDPELGFHSDSEVSRMINSVAGLAFRCLRLRGKMRPSMEEVFTVLKGIKDGGQDRGRAVNIVGHYIFPHEELHAATNSFDSSQELSDGSIDKVYHGELRDGRRVAVKVLNGRDPYKLDQMIDEVTKVSLLCHKNLVTLYGCTNRLGREMSLVYEYVPNGSIAEHLYDQRLVLNWAVRIQIAIETTEALAYLHSLEPSIIHCNVKTSNILLDSSFHVKVASLGLCHVAITPHGRLGYWDPEYKDYSGCKLTCKSDVYSLGVVLVELISGKQPDKVIEGLREFAMDNIALNKIINKELETLVDPKLGYNFDVEVKRMVNSVATLAFRCLQLEEGMRPPMLEVLEVLKEIKFGKKHIHNKEREEEEVDVAGRVFSHQELRLATDSFNPSRDLQGNGKVFLGKLEGGPKVVVKKVINRHFDALENLFDEVPVVSCLHHENLVTLYGCTKPRNLDMFLVYEYVPNCRTLKDLLHGKISDYGEENKMKKKHLALNWALRIQIAIETAEALSYLHCQEPPILHTDVTASNILLDDNFHVKLIGLSLFTRFTAQGGVGTRGYLDPAYDKSWIFKLITAKSDVYSFGVVLMELISGRPAYDKYKSRGEEYLAVVALNKIQNNQLDQLVDISPDYHSDWYTKRLVPLVAELACKCLLPEGNMRPSMADVLSSLKQIRMGKYR